jgi:uncharacterized membrane protein YhaH (DUF805 family)
MKIISIIRYNLVNLLNFRGRDARSIFWPYIAFLFTLLMILNAVVMISEMARLMQDMHQYALENPDSATIHQSATHYSVTVENAPPALMPDMGGLVYLTATITACMVIGMAAATTRRLHDIGKSGAWGLLPVPFLTFSFAMMPQIFQQSPPDMAWFTAIFINNMLYIGCIIYLIILLARAGYPDDNRFGPAPAAV